jgi:hypothetical protein
MYIPLVGWQKETIIHNHWLVKLYISMQNMKMQWTTTILWMLTHTSTSHIMENQSWILNIWSS